MNIFKTSAVALAALAMVAFGATSAGAADSVPSGDSYVEARVGILTGFGVGSLLSDDEGPELMDEPVVYGFEAGRDNFWGTPLALAFAYDTFDVNENNDYLSSRRYHLLMTNAYWKVPFGMPFDGSLKLGAGLGLSNSDGLDFSSFDPVLAGHVRYDVPVSGPIYIGVGWTHYNLMSSVLDANDMHDSDSGSGAKWSFGAGYRF